MAKVSPNTIQNLDEDWGLDQNTNLPFSGESVQAFIKSFLRNVTTAAWFDTTTATMYFFASEADRDSFINDTSQSSLPVFSCPMNFSGELYRVNLTNDNGSTSLNVATNSGTLPLSVSYVVQKKSITDTSWTDTVTRCYVTVLIDRGLTGSYTPITERTLYNSGATVSLDIFGYLATGANHVKIQFEAEDGSVTTALTYTITLAELYVEPFNNFWYLPVLENDETTHRLGGFKIAGAGSKTLHLAIFDSQGSKVFEDSVIIGTTNSYASTPYYYAIAAGSDILDLSTGVYKVQVHVSTSAIDSEVFEYHVMFVATEDAATAKLICVNDVAEKVFNYSTANLCSYAVYDGGATYADLSVDYCKKDGETVVDDDHQPLENILTSTQQSLTYEALWENIEGAGYFIGFTLSLGNASVSADIPLDNSSVFPPTPNYDFYLLASQRSNGETDANRKKIVNAANGEALPADWTDVDFINGVDGWTEDDKGRRCLRIPAGTKMVLPYTAFNLLSGDNQTFEICYKAANVADSDENVITISPNPAAAGFQGIRIKPTMVTVHTGADSNADNDSKQGTTLCDEEVVHFVLTINPYFEGSHKLAKGFVNGCKNFLFSYTNRTQWSDFNGNLAIGSEKTDVFVYFIRHYPVALSDAAVQVNYINSLTTVAERNTMDAKFASVLDAGGTNVDFEAVKNSGFNFFVVTMEQGNGIPSAANGWGKKTTGVSTLEMHFGSHPEWDWKMSGLETMGQGTTSMNYYRWNVRWRIDKSNSDKKIPVAYLESRTKSGGKFFYTWGEASNAKTVRFDGPNHPPVMRITAKTNQASSMQSHKIGATRAYSELHDAIGLSNEAQDGADPRPVVAVYQYPAFGFEYDPGTDTYAFVGLFTIGPDKGDKPTFGFDTTKNSLISLEGTDHSQPLAKFAYPWNGDVNYFYNEEGLAIDLGEGNFLTGLEIGNCHGKEIDKEKGAGDQSDVRNIILDEFKPAYEVAWKNSTLIFPISSSHSTYGVGTASQILAAINADIENFRSRHYAGNLSVADMQFWIENDSDCYLYYYDEKDGEYKADISLVEQNGTPPAGATLLEKNEWFKAQRRARFMADAGNYWDLDECLYHFVFCLIFGATDNFAKNSYPYKMAAIANGGRWRWRQDDLDTIFDIDNSGRDTKAYDIEFRDTVNGSAIFAGSNSVFWNLINECFWDDYDNGLGSGIRSIGRKVLNAMMRLSGKGNPYDGFVGYIGKCFWDNAQDYFPASAYNVDSVFKYELAWIVNGQEVPALSQALGNHYSGERLWVRRRAVYMLSLFRYGPFGDYSDKTLGRIGFRPLSIAVSLIPNMRLYPALLVGQNAVVSGDRTAEGAACNLSATVDASGNTFAYIQGTNILSSLGSFKDIRLGENDKATVEIEGAKLVKFEIGDAEKANVTTNIPGLKFTGTKCLEEIDARNAESIKEITGLQDCTRLRALQLIGTTVTSVDIPSGSKLETLSLPATIQRIALVGLHHLSAITDETLGDVVTFIVEDCPGIDAFGLLSRAKDESGALRNIRLIWSGVLTDDTGTLLAELAEIDQGDYQGVSAAGETTQKPCIDGVIDISGVSDPIVFPAWLSVTSDGAYGTGKRIATIGNFNTGLSVIYNPAKTRFVGFLRDSGGGRIKTSDGKYVTL